MFFRQDWLMRQVDMLVQAFARLLLGKDAGDTLLEEWNESSTAGEADPFAAELNALLDEGKINEAEDLLFDRIGGGDPAYIKTGLEFYARVNRRSDEFLEAYDFSREEVREGLEDFARSYGINLK